MTPEPGNGFKYFPRVPPTTCDGSMTSRTAPLPAPHAAPAAKASRSQLIAAFAAVYILWGSTYLAIRFAIETLPPWLMASARFIVAGGILYAIARARGAVRPTRINWAAALLIGGLLLLGGNGAVVWAETRVPSGLTALLVATVPIWMVLLDWLQPAGNRPTRGVIAGLVLGFIGLGVLIGPGEILGRGQVDLLGAAALTFGSITWAAGSVYSRRVSLPSSPLLATGMEMLGGGVLLGVLSLVTGEAATFAPAAVTLHSVLALLYLIVFGSLIGFTAYIWLLGHASAARVSTYAFVNPVVAVILGWAMANEELTPRMLLAAAVIVAAVALITMGRTTRQPKETLGDRVPPAPPRERAA